MDPASAVSVGPPAFAPPGFGAASLVRSWAARRCSFRHCRTRLRASAAPPEFLSARSEESAPVTSKRSTAATPSTCNVLHAHSVSRHQIDDMESFRLTRRWALICLSGAIAAPFVIRNAGMLMPVRNRLLWRKKSLSGSNFTAWARLKQRLELLGALLRGPSGGGCALSRRRCAQQPSAAGQP